MKKYSLKVHAIHSRLQLIKDKIDADAEMHPSQVVIRNLKYFERAGASVETQHSLHCDRSDFVDAAELFQMTLEKPEPEKYPNQFMVITRSGRDEWYPISTDTLPNGLSGEIKPLTQAEANELCAEMRKQGGTSNYQIANYKPQK